MPETKLVALCDLDARRVDEAAQKVGGDLLRFTNYDQMLDAAKLDMVVVATPMPFHVSHSVSAINRGIHVLSEVPAATDLEQCWQLVSAVRANPNVKYMMAENCCYM
jgi:predicted dehydrogenase